MRLKHLFPGLVVLALLSTFAGLAQQQKPAAKKPIARQASDKVDEGQHVFEQHCSRCHNAPEGFSPRISGTIVRHMRVRASLSQHEEEALLRFFNP
jgi:cytochrome c5